MNCPQCRSALLEQDIQGVSTHICRVCRVAVVFGHAVPKLTDGVPMPAGGAWGLQVAAKLSFAGARPHQELMGPAAFCERLGRHGGENSLMLVYVENAKAHIKRDGAERFREAADDTLLFEIRRRVSPSSAITRDGDAYLIHEALPRSFAEAVQRSLEKDITELHPLGADVRIRVHVQSYIGSRGDYAALFNHLLRISRHRPE